MPVLPIPHPMDEVHGGKMFWCKLHSRFRGVQTCILGSYKQRFKPPLVVRVPRTTRGGRKKGKHGGYSPPTPPTRNNVPGPDQWAHRTPNTTQPGDTPAARKHPGQLQTKIQTIPIVRVPRTIGIEEKREKRKAWGAVRPQTPNQDVGWSQWARRRRLASLDPLLRSLDPISGRIAHQIRYNLGSYDIFPLGIPFNRS